MASWDNIKLPSAGGGDFLKLESDKIYQLAFLGEPEVVQKDWGDGKGLSFRVHSNVVDTTAPDKVLIYDMPVSVAQQVKSIFEMASPETTIKVKKTGAGLQTKYIVVAGSAIKPETLKKLQALELHELGSPGDTASAPEVDEDVPF
jgi:hypothetical protein